MIIFFLSNPIKTSQTRHFSKFYIKSGSRSLALQGYFISIASKMLGATCCRKMLNKLQRMKDCLAKPNHNQTARCWWLVGVGEKWLIIRVFI